MAIHATGRQADEPGLEYRRPRRRTSASAHQQRRQVPYLCRDLHAREQALYYRGHRAGGLPRAGVVSAIAGMARREWDRASLSVCLLQRIPDAPAGQARRAAVRSRFRLTGLALNRETSCLLDERVNMRFKSGLCLAICAMAFALPVFAHHSHGNYVDTFMDIEGVVKELHLVVPHSWIYLEVKDPKG